MSRRIDTARPWHERMAQARRWHARMMTVANRRPPNHEALMAAAAECVPDGWRLAPELTANDVRADFLRVIRRNLGNRRLP